MCLPRSGRGLFCGGRRPTHLLLATADAMVPAAAPAESQSVSQIRWGRRTPSERCLSRLGVLRGRHATPHVPWGRGMKPGPQACRALSLAAGVGWSTGSKMASAWGRLCHAGGLTCDARAPARQRRLSYGRTVIPAGRSRPGACGGGRRAMQPRPAACCARQAAQARPRLNRQMVSGQAPQDRAQRRNHRAVPHRRRPPPALSPPAVEAHEEGGNRRQVRHPLWRLAA